MRITHGSKLNAGLYDITLSLRIPKLTGGWFPDLTYNASLSCMESGDTTTLFNADIQKTLLYLHANVYAPVATIVYEFDKEVFCALEWYFSGNSTGNRDLQYCVAYARRIAQFSGLSLPSSPVVNSNPAPSPAPATIPDILPSYSAPPFDVLSSIINQSAPSPQIDLSGINLGLGNTPPKPSVGSPRPPRPFEPDIY